MKILFLACIVLIPVAGVATEIDLRSPGEQPGAGTLAQKRWSATVTTGIDAEAVGGSEVDSSGPKPAAPQQPQKASKSTKRKQPSKPPVEGSMVGYIDNAIPGSQVRVRFDAAFHSNVPDRAEFLYAQYAGLTLGAFAPGPHSVVTDLNFQQLYFYAEYAPTKRFSFLTEVPVRWTLPQNTVANVTLLSPPFPNVNEAGLSDVAAGFKLAALASSNHYLTFQFKAFFPSGNASKGLGTNNYSVEPALLYYQRLSERVTLEAQVGDSHPIGGSFCPQPCVTDPRLSSPASGGFAGDVFFYGVGPSYVLYQGRHAQIAPVIELVGWRVLGGLQTLCLPGIVNGIFNPCDNQEAASADGTNIVNLKVGVRTSIGKRNSFYAGFGHAVTHSHWYEDIVRAEYRYSF